MYKRQLVRGYIYLDTEANSAFNGAVSKSNSTSGRVKEAVSGEQVIGHLESQAPRSITRGDYLIYINLLK